MKCFVTRRHFDCAEIEVDSEAAALILANAGLIPESAWEESDCSHDYSVEGIKETK